MSKENPTGLSPQEKEDINKEGFEGQAAILIGKKEEMPNLVERLEKEGRAADLETYIRMHKQIIVPANERESIQKRMGEYNEKGMAFFYHPSEHDPSGCQSVTFIDSDNNLARVLIDTEKVEIVSSDGYYGSNREERCDIIAEKLKEMGFKVLAAKEHYVHDVEDRVDVGNGRKIPKGFLWDDWYQDEHKYKEKLEEQAKNQREKEFNF